MAALTLSPPLAYAFVSHGVGIAVALGDGVPWEGALSAMPPNAIPTTVLGADVTYELARRRESSKQWILSSNGKTIASSVELDVLFGELEADIRMTIETISPRHVFIHAGVVAWGGRAIVFPGRSHAGKSTLVRSLLAAGATYYSDEFAVLNPSGMVLPYPRAISICGPGGRRRVPANQFGAPTGAGPVPLGTLLVTEFERGESWAPRTLSTGEALLACLQDTVTAQSFPARSMATIERFLAPGRYLAGLRGEADDVARILTAADGECGRVSVRRGYPRAGWDRCPRPATRRDPSPSLSPSKPSVAAARTDPLVAGQVVHAPRQGAGSRAASPLC